MPATEAVQDQRAPGHRNFPAHVEQAGGFMTREHLGQLSADQAAALQPAGITGRGVGIGDDKVNDTPVAVLHGP